MAVMKLKTLENHLSGIEVFDAPKIEYEQYTTTPHLSASLLHCIQSQYGDIEGKIVGDLGCGCGILSIGCCLLGAASCTGFDIDFDALLVFLNNLSYYDITNCDALNVDVKYLNSEWDNFFDTVVMNPPFGTRNKGIDVDFLQTALRLATVVYSLHKTSTRDYLLKKAKEWNVQCNVIAELKFDLPPTYKFHNKKSVDVHVDVIQMISR